MANLSQTAANVVAQAGARINKSYKYGGTVTAGMPIYIDAADGKAKAADNNVTAALANAPFLALNSGSDNQPADLLEDGDVNIGATLTVGETYIVSATAGAIAPVADVSTGFVTVLGVAISASLLRFKPIVSGIAHA